MSPDGANRRIQVKYILIVAVSVLVLGSVGGAMAQTATGTIPVPNASGSQVSDPTAYGSSAEYFRQHPGRLPRADRPRGETDASRRRMAPVPNASGSEVTNPNMYR